jgi:hypothetical protein
VEEVSANQEAIIPKHEEIVDRYERNEIEILANKSAARLVYPGLLKGATLARAFHILSTVYSFPLTILAGIVVPIIFGKYIYIRYYLLGFGLITWFEGKLMVTTVTNAVLENPEIYRYLFIRKIILIQEKLKR